MVDARSQEPAPRPASESEIVSEAPRAEDERLRPHAQTTEPARTASASVRIPAEIENLSRLLPEPAAPVPDASFHDRFLLLLAATARPEGLLTYRHYRLSQEACRLVFGEQALHARLQAKLHHALLNPLAPHDAQRLARIMADQARQEQLPAATVAGVLQALRHVCPPADSPAKEALPSPGKKLLEEIELAFQPQTAQNAPSWAEKSGFDVEARLSDLCRRAARQLGLLNDDEDAPASSAPADPELVRAGLEKPLSALETVATVMDDANFARELAAFRKLMRSQPCRLAVVGEGKRGKSTVLNAILGMELTPVREAAAQTGTVLRVQRAASPAVRVLFHDAAHLERLELTAKADPDNVLLARDLERIRQGLADGRFAPGATHTLDPADMTQSLTDCLAFLRADGPFSGLVHRVEIDLAESVLGGNVSLSDTPGLNHFNPFLAELATQEALEADCVVFIMDARSPGSGSELELLRQLARSGRSVCVIGVLTHADQLADPDSALHAREQARAVLREACRVSKHVRLGGVVLVNARQAALERCTDKQSIAPSGRCGEFATLFTLLREAVDMDADKAAHRGKVAENFQALTRTAGQGLRRHMEESLSRMPGPELLAMLEAHAGQLHEATRLSLEQARQVVRTTLDDMDSWERNTERGLNRFAETLVLRLMEAVNAKVTAQGRNFAKASVWTTFDNVEAQTIARESVEEFLTEQREVLAAWEAKLRMFSNRMDECTRVCLAGAGALNELDAENVMAPETERATHFLVQTHHYMKNIAVFATGAAIGRATFLSPLAVVISAGNMLALAIASPMIAAVVAAVAGTAGLVYHLGREDKRRAAFLERRRHEAEAYAERVTNALREELRRARMSVAELYESEVRKGFSPALDSLFYQSAHLRLFLDTMHTIRADVARTDTEARNTLKTLSDALTRKGIELH